MEITVTVVLHEGEPAVAKERVGETGSCGGVTPGSNRTAAVVPSETELRERAELSSRLLALVLERRASATGTRVPVDACSLYRRLFARIALDSLPAPLIAQLDSTRPNANGYCLDVFVGDGAGYRIVVDEIDVAGPADPVIRLRVVDAPRVHRESYYLRKDESGTWEVFEARVWGAYRIKLR